ncbi:SDR family oxidoreductase [Stigmatella aurantiaca]|uniref:Insect-type dehydrogenase n=1 Tax=Stigmatella aurantiaca (strain DW4/3-1) TaxID=378806 RepID=Q08XK8_STIAD|nr:SDR family oxidoreductase [Stigmatella aurantiaca]ADO70537.1 Short-chain dehydrogenase/reductase SDR [Stigmatella aurantiaca DW4/3-1]EAU65203.1 insect-type dehydrogenase [Stigmatella aurantiaca DW4/3-1]
MKTVLLTGTSSGLGEAAARLFLARGWNVVATARDAGAAVQGAAGSNLLRARLDVTDASSIDAVFEEAASRFGAIDVVVNNAGVGLGGPLEAIELSQWREHFEVNLMGVVAVCRVAVAHMRPRRAGLIINVSSAAGRVGLPFLSPYNAGKFAVEGLTESLHFELKPHGVRVKLVEPGGVRSKFTHPWVKHVAYEREARAVQETMERGQERSARPEAAAKTIFAAANDSSDRLRYRASNAAALLALHAMLPETAWRALVRQGFGLSSARAARKELPR